MSTYEALSLMISFATLVILIINIKNNSPLFANYGC